MVIVSVDSLTKDIMSSPLHANESTGQKMVEAGWLDVHYQASRTEYEAMLRAAGIEKGWSVLDAGAGSGSYLPLLSELVGSEGFIHALDLAEENVAAMRKFIDDSPLCCPVEIEAGSVLELPFEDESFDAVWCANTMQYFQPEAWEKIIVEFHRVLKPGGLVAIKEFDDVGLNFGPFDPVLIWRLLGALRGSDLILGAGSLHTVELPQYLRTGKFDEIRFQSFVGDFQEPLTEVQREFLTSALELYSGLAEQVDLSDGDLAEWCRCVGDPESADYILNDPDFYFREVHGLATGRKEA